MAKKYCTWTWCYTTTFLSQFLLLKYVLLWEYLCTQRRNKTNPPKGRNAEMFKNKSNKNNKRLKQSTRMRKIFVFDSQGVFANDFVSNFWILTIILQENLSLVILEYWISVWCPFHCANCNTSYCSIMMEL